MAKVKEFFVKFSNKWGITSIWQFVVIMLVFACTGISILIVKGWIFSALDVNSSTPVYWRILLFIGITLPTYQILLLFYGFLFGKFRIFWAYEKRFFNRLVSIFNRKRE